MAQRSSFAVHLIPISLCFLLLGGCASLAERARREDQRRTQELARLPLASAERSRPVPLDVPLRVVVQPAGISVDDLGFWARQPLEQLEAAQEEGEGDQLWTRPRQLVALGPGWALPARALREPGSYLVTPLYEGLLEIAQRQKAQARRGRQRWSFEALLYVHPETPYKLLVQVLYTLGQAESGEFRFAVQRGSGVVALPVSVPKICATPCSAGGTKPAKGEGLATRLGLAGGLAAALTSAEDGGFCREATLMIGERQSQLRLRDAVDSGCSGVERSPQVPAKELARFKDLLGDPGVSDRFAASGPSPDLERALAGAQGIGTKGQAEPGERAEPRGPARAARGAPASVEKPPQPEPDTPRSCALLPNRAEGSPDFDGLFEALDKEAGPPCSRALLGGLDRVPWAHLAEALDRLRARATASVVLVAVAEQSLACP